jgi:hypothetical protein
MTDSIIYQAKIHVNAFLEKIRRHGCRRPHKFQILLRITSRLYMTLPAPHKATRSIAGAGNVP